MSIIQNLEQKPSSNKFLGFFDWKRILRKESKECIPFEILKQNTRKHFPILLRPRVWMFFTDNYALESRNYYGSDYYKFLLHKSLNEKVSRDIEKDVLRTFSSFSEFNSEDKYSLRHSLRRVLHATALDNPGLEYVQGMNFIAAGLVYGLSPDKYENRCFSFGRNFYSSTQNEKIIKEEYFNFEELAFWLMKYIFQKLNWKEVFGRNFAKVRSLFGSFETRLDHTPLRDAFYSLKEAGIGKFELFSPFFYSLLLNKVSLEITPKIIDIFLLETENGIIDLLLNVLLTVLPVIEKIQDRPDKILKLIQEDLFETAIIMNENVLTESI